MIIALALPTNIHALLTILGAGTLTFLVLLIYVASNFASDKPISKSGIAVCGLCTVAWVLLKAFVFRG